MSLRILDFRMASNRTRHTARIVPGTQHAWEVSWLPGRNLNRNEAITAMVIADTTAYGDVHPGHQSWPHIENWAATLGITAPQAIDRIVGPPKWAKRPEPTAELPTEYRLWGVIEDPDPIDLGLTEEPEWLEFEPDYPHPCWHGWGRGLKKGPTFLTDQAVADWEAGQ